jgi:hypothetical protein
MCRACHIKKLGPDGKHPFDDSSKPPQNDERINCTCTWMVGKNEEKNKASWVAMPCYICLVLFHKPVSKDRIVDIYGNAYNAMHLKPPSEEEKVKRAKIILNKVQGNEAAATHIIKNT